jgi:hypothetical protein
VRTSARQARFTWGPTSLRVTCRSVSLVRLDLRLLLTHPSHLCACKRAQQPGAAADRVHCNMCNTRATFTTSRVSTQKHDRVSHTQQARRICPEQVLRSASFNAGPIESERKPKHVPVNLTYNWQGREILSVTQGVTCRCGSRQFQIYGFDNQ